MDGNFNARILRMSIDAESAVKSANEAFLFAEEALRNATPPPPAGMKNRAQRRWRRAYLRNNTNEVARLDQVAVGNTTQLAREEAFGGDQNPIKFMGFCSGVSGKGGIMAPPGLTVEGREVWRLEHNERWKKMTPQERARLQQQQSEKLRSNRRTSGLKTAQQYGSCIALADDAQAQQIKEPGNNETRTHPHSPAPEALEIGEDACGEDIKYDSATQTLHQANKLSVDDTAPAMVIDPVDEAVEVLDESEFHAKTPYDHVINVNSAADFVNYVIDYDGHPATCFDLGPLFKFSDTHVEEILRKGHAFTDNVIQITAGNPELRQPLTDMGLIHLVAACPRLEYLSIHGGSNITDDSLSVVLEHCPRIRHIALCGADFEPNNMCGWPLLELMQGSAATSLDKIAVMNTAVDAETVRKLRDLRPGLRISARG